MELQVQQETLTKKILGSSLIDIIKRALLESGFNPVEIKQRPETKVISFPSINPEVPSIDTMLIEPGREKILCQASYTLTLPLGSRIELVSKPYKPDVLHNQIELVSSMHPKRQEITQEFLQELINRMDLAFERIKSYASFSGVLEPVEVILAEGIPINWHSAADHTSDYILCNGEAIIFTKKNDQVEVQKLDELDYGWLSYHITDLGIGLLGKTIVERRRFRDVLFSAKEDTSSAREFYQGIRRSLELIPRQHVPYYLDAPPLTQSV